MGPIFERSEQCITYEQAYDTAHLSERFCHMHTSITQGETLRALFSAHPILRARELRAAGVAPETIARAVESGDIARIARGIYQLHEDRKSTRLNYRQ